MANEAKTVRWVNTKLRELGYEGDENVIIEEQQSPALDKWLKNASKSGNGKGYPEHIITFKNRPDDVILIECKADFNKHESEARDNYKDYAVDGVLLYANHVKRGFNVHAIAVSGETKDEIKISQFVWLKDKETYKEIADKDLLSLDSQCKLFSREKKPIKDEDLIKKAIEYNTLLHSYSIPEVHRCTVISSILVALQHKPFALGYTSYHEELEDETYNPNKDLIEALLNAANSVLGKNGISVDKKEVILSEYLKTKNILTFSDRNITKNNETQLNTVLRDLIHDVNKNIIPYIDDQVYDILGQFYTHFIRYAGSDSKTGLVLTPHHITDLFSELGEIDVNDIVLDTCCGTAGFLVSAMKTMLMKANNDENLKRKIKKHHLVGIEKRSDMFAHACSNMMMRGDGKSNIYHGDCFDDKLINEIKKNHKVTKSFLNPPYDVGPDGQLNFVLNAMSYIQKGGICISICQMSTCTDNKSKTIEARRRLLEKHTLEAVLSVPDDLFHPVGVVTSILIFKAHTPHVENRKTFFGYFKDDGFYKAKHQGRIGDKQKWSIIKNNWLEVYRNKESVAGLSVMKSIGARDEWCAEAYMETNYSKLTKEIFIKNIKSFLSYKLLSTSSLISISSKPFKEISIELNHENWKYFHYENIFRIEKGKRLTKREQIKGDYPYISSSSLNNGVDSTIGNGYTDKNCITFACYGSIGEVFFQEKEVWVSDNSNVFYLKNRDLNPYLSLFLLTLLKLESFRFSYGMTGRKSRLQNFTIKLPTTSGGEPDWQFMEDYIKSLPYSLNL